MVAPIPISDPAIGNGLAAAGLALYSPRGSERPWTTGVGGLYTDSKSWAAFAGQKAYLDRDRFRVTAGGGGGVFNVDFYGIGPGAGDRGRSIPIEQKAAGGLAEALIRVRPHMYAGLEYRIIDMRTTVKLDELPFEDLEIPGVELRSRTSALGLAGEYDTRDSEYQPTRGLYATGMWLQAAEALGGDFDYHRAEFALNGYRALGGDATLAWRGSVCSVGAGAPFYDLCNFGSQSDLRGYVNGQYRDQAMFAVQAEYRRPLFWRFGGTVFAGVGEVGPGFGDMNADNLLPAAGVGLRFKASEEYGVNIRLDYAWGKDSEAFYVSIGEAF
ncbi:BamA/TamA family outer membrane protein [Phenylobacterium sp. J367]|uniref:BamA/TamA family outer membrane protein n=1 Tax=Phenylobacterium sp. J367 TaxID=2898435 RepID=UPI002151C5AB|nr:BamA/TamA family outer membrane protein [Phenylobacterium sp. J367]MCR5877188.1 BamA/TamA family outer membrane protein [Phenylobacterium sp. J367]